MRVPVGKALVADCPARSRANELRIFMENAAGVLMWQRLPANFASLKFSRINQEIQGAISDIDSNDVTVVNKGDRSPINGFRCNMSNTETR
jgi:hypothetical protein